MSPVNRGLPILIFLSLAPLAIGACSGDTTGLDPNDGGPACTNDDSCPPDQHCENSVCVAGTGNECTMDSECGPGQECVIVENCGAMRCHGNACEAKSCTDTSMCEGWYCDNGTCTDPGTCTTTADCPPDFSCGADGKCTYTPPTTCEADQDCTAANTICVAGMCVLPTACEETADCPQGQRCINMVCNDPCMSNSDCGSAIYACNMMTGECQQRCANDNQCPANTICESFLCVAAECTMDSDCTGTGMVECQGEENGHGRCNEIFACDAPGGCPVGTACNMMTNRCEALPECVGDRDCDADEYCELGYCQPSSTCSAQQPCPANYDCIGGTCVPELCRGNADCTVPGETCVAGSCEPPPSTMFITQVRILTPAGFVRPGTTYRFIAVALDQTGAIIPGVTFNWGSSMEPVATIDADGLATGGAVAGTTLITASVNNHSASVNLTNLGELAATSVRITVVSAAGGAPISGAAVDLEGSFAATSVTTGADGVAVFENIPAGSYAVTAGSSNYDYVSILGIETRDVLLPLPPVTKPTVAGGIKGSVDFTNVTAQGAVSLSLNGASIGSPLVAFDPGALFGGDLFTLHINIPGQGNVDVPAPAASTLAVDFLGTPINLKDTYYARGATGIRGGWSFAGRFGLDVLRGNTGAGGNLIGAILPYLQRFTHGVRPVVDVVALPTVTDTNDIDGDGDTAESVPNYAQFPSVALTPDTAQALRYNIAVDNLPVVTAGNANALIVIGGVLLPSVGFVPLGLDGLNDDSGNGIVEPFTTKIAPPHGGLEVGDYAILATAVRLEGGALPGPGSARLLVTSRLPEDVDMSDGWMDSPVDASWTSAVREMNLPPVANADMYRIAFAHGDGTWHVFAPTPSMPDTLRVPLAPMGLVDRTGTGTISVDAIDLVAGQSPGTVFELSAGGILALDHATRGFARANVGP